MLMKNEDKKESKCLLEFVTKIFVGKMLNLNGVHKHLVNNYKNVNFAVMNPLSYINTLSQPTGKILLIYSKTTPPSSPAQYKIDEAIDDNKTSRLDVTGTPLEDDFHIDVIDDLSVNKEIVKVNAWSKGEEVYSSVKTDLVKDIFNELNMDRENKCRNGSVYALCDDVQFLLSIHYDDNWNIRGVGKFIGLIPFTEIDVSKMMKYHIGCLRNCNKADTEIETTFNLKPNQLIKLSWTTTSLTPSIQHNKSADVTLWQSITVGNYDSRVLEFWRQLEILEGIKLDILKYKKRNSNNNLVYSCCESSLPFNSIEEHIIEVLSNITSSEMAKQTDTIDLESVISRMETQRMLNVTDQLWNVLKFCSSYNDLLQALNLVLQCAAQSKVVNMPTNSNRLACMIREISEKRLVIPRLSGSEPLEILLEIGLQKLTKDYEHIFVESKICSSTVYQSFIQDLSETSVETVHVNVRKTLQHAAHARKTIVRSDETVNDVGFEYTHFDRIEVDRKLAKLAQVHLTLEHMLLIQINLNVDHTVLGAMMNNFPKSTVEFDRLQSMKFDEREFPITDIKIFSKIEHRNPHLIKIKMKSENRFKLMENTYLYSVDPICPPNVFPYMQNSEEIVNSEILYCGLHYTKVGSRKR